MLTPSGVSLASWIRFLLRHRVAASVVLVLSLAAAVVSALRIQVRFQYRDFYDYPKNPDLPTFDKYTADFGDPGGYAIILVEAKDVFAPEVLAWIDQLTRDLEPEKIFSHVHSLANAKTVHGSGDDVESGKIMARVPATAAEADHIRQIALGSSLIVRRLVASDSTATVILAEMRSPIAPVNELRATSDTLRAALKKRPPPTGVAAHVTGAPEVEVKTTDYLLYDQAMLMPVSMLLIVVMLFIGFRSAAGVILPLAAVTTATLWTAGLFPFFGRPIDMFGSTMPATLLVYGVVDPIFVFSRYLRKLEAGRSREDAIVESLSELGLPCFLTSLTTALGFFSFITATLPQFISYGRTIGIGVSLAFVTTSTVLPLLLSIFPAPRVRPSQHGVSKKIDGALVWAWDKMRGRSWTIVGVALVILGGAGWYGHVQHVNSLYVGVLPKSETLDSVRTLERKLSGVSRSALYIVGKEGDMKRPEVLQAVAEVDSFEESEPLIRSSVSLADLVAEINQAFHGGDPMEHRVPESRALIAQYLAMLSPEELTDFVDASYSRTHIRLLSEDQGSRPFREMRARLETEVARRFAKLDVTATITGYGPTGFKATDELAVDMVWGFAGAFAIVVLFELLLFRSLRIALISILPNLLPVVLTFSLLRLLGIDMRIDSVLFLSVSIGGLFNTTIHFAQRVRQLQAEGVTDPDEVVGGAMRAVGPPALFTALVLSLGFAVFMLSRFPGLRDFGMLAMATLTCGFFSDMIVTAALLRLFYNWKGGAREIASDSRAAAGS
jgi:predicted RND superfamily exporter protein